MKKLISFFIIFLMTSHADAALVDFSNVFRHTTGCFILYDLTNDKMITQYNPQRCQQRIPPDSTFKVVLSLMAFDQELISHSTVFKWDGRVREYPDWNHDQTPQSWLHNSALWVSQVLTPKIGLVNIKNYLQEFGYGNQDFSGDPGKHNALEHAWVTSSLKISADEQLVFLKKLLRNQLPVTQAAMQQTKENMFVETSRHGWKLYGKTGTGNYQHVQEDAWFIGYVEKANQTYVFVTNFSDLETPALASQGGPRARNMTKALLDKIGIY
jgi:beta-lactamase class D